MKIIMISSHTDDAYRMQASDSGANAFINKSSKGALTAYPTVTSETLFWLNVRRPYMRFLISSSKKFGFGFTGFKAAQGNNKVAGQILASIQMFVRSPRNHAQVYGFVK